MTADSTDPKALTPLQRAFLALEAAEAKARALEEAAREPIAVVGASCRIPGAPDLDAFWRLLRDGVDAVAPIPPERFGGLPPGSTSEAALLPSIDGFDPAFFGISPREAQGMDPQQRLLLEVAWEALERAGIAPDRLEGSPTGVYVGIASSDYAYLQLKSDDPSLLDAHYTSGVAHSVASGRLSYVLGLQGPSVSVDTACSSSLVAVHLAVQALRAGECRMALAGGVNVIASPDLFVAFSNSRMLAPDGRCKTFDAAADGFGRAEGCGVVVLKRLSDAIADGDPVMAVIRATAVNQDGPSSGLTAPNGPAQEAVIRAALARAGFSPSDIGYVEAHGTGTQLGDPLEVRALAGVFAAGRAADRPLRIGSAKTNVGHLESAAGITGLLKLVLSLQHGQIPPHLHLRTPSPHIPWSELPFEVPTRLQPWAPIGGRRIGGVSAFGYSGTNAHAIVEAAPPRAVATGAARPRHLLTLSAREPAALAELAARHATRLDDAPDTPLADLCWTANAGRARFAHRAAIVATDAPGLRDALRALAAGRDAPGVRTGRVAQGEPPRVAFLFTGQGAQHPGMAAALYREEPAFRAALDRCAAVLGDRLGAPLHALLWPAAGTPSRLDETAITQPALFAVEWSLAELWRSWGVVPSVVAGHSLGEFVAACVAGVISLEDALGLVAERGRLMQSLPAGGAMAAVFAPVPDVEAAIAPYGDRVSIAAVNAPGQVVISGDGAAVEAIRGAFGATGVRCTPLLVSHAFHSPLVEPILDAFERRVAATPLHPPRLRLVSNVTGAVARPEEIVQPGYWRRHARAAVRFADTLETLASLRVGLCIEIGPHPTLLGFARATLGTGCPPIVATLRRDADDVAQSLQALADAFVSGVDVDWRGVHAHDARTVVPLPTYPFQRQRCWFVARPAERAPAGRPTGHPILGARIPAATSERIYQSTVAADRPAYVLEHRVQGRVVVPATAYVDAFEAAARDAFGPGTHALDDVVVRQAMLLEDPPQPGRTVQVIVSRVDGDTLDARLCSTSGADDAWIEHASARLRRAAPVSRAPGPSLQAARAACAEAIPNDAFYAGLAGHGLDFGPSFRSVARLWRGDGEALGEVVLAEPLRGEAAGHAMHPVLLDGCLQVLAAATPTDAHGALFLPIGLGRCVVHLPGATRCWSHVRVAPSAGRETRRASLTVFDDAGRVVAEVDDLSLKRVEAGTLGRIGERWIDDALYAIDWVPAPGGDAGVASSALAAVGTSAVDARIVAEGLDAYDRAVPTLERLSAEYVICAMAALGWSPRAGDRVVPEDFADRYGVLPCHLRLLARLFAILAEEGVLRPEGGVWTVTRPLPEVDPAATLASLRVALPAAAAELDFTASAGDAFADALRGRCDPLQLLFPGGSTGTAERLYRDAPLARVYNGAAAEVVASAVEAARAAGRRCRILEVGAGTGGTTAHVLPRLAGDGVEYTFTDVGPLFVERARERFAAHPFVRYAVVDLERDPVAQGLEAGGFDLIVASNVVHATRDLRATLGRLHGLLAPGGTIAMLEVTAPRRWFDVTVGLTEGWWCFEDTALRPDYPTLPADRWLALLRECGFDEAVAVPAGPVALAEAPRSSAGNAMLLARRPGLAADARVDRWLLVADREGTVAALGERLRARGARCTVVRAGAAWDDAGADWTVDPADPEQLDRLVGRLEGEGGRWGAVLGWALDDAAGRDDGQAGSVPPGAGHVRRFAQAVLRRGASPRIRVLTRGAQAVEPTDAGGDPAQAPVAGVVRALAVEHPELDCVAVDLSPGATRDGVDALPAELDAPALDRAVALRPGGRRVPRLVRAQDAPEPEGPVTWVLEAERAGSIDAFRRAADTRRAPGPGEVEIEVEAVGLNFRDVLNVLGMYPGDAPPLGGECAGRVASVGPGVTGLAPGDRVMAIAARSFASHAIARAEFVRRCPDGMSAAEAASVPIAFVTAGFCLERVAGLRAGERVLIHSAAGGVGLAAVRLALRAGAEVYATAGTESKRAMLRDLGVRLALDSRRPGFAGPVLEATGGRGVDVVLNALAGEAIDESFRAIADGGRFVEIGKRGIKSPDEVDAMGRGLRYTIVDWTAEALREPATIAALFGSLADAIGRGELAPLPRRVFPIGRVDRAFRTMAEGRHVGKIVVSVVAEPPAVARHEGSYLVTGGLSGLGLLTARWLAERGAGHLVLVGRRAPDDAAAAALDAIRALGARVTVAALDVSDRAALQALLARVRADGPPLRGVFHSAGALADAVFVHQDDARFAVPMASKVVGAGLLDALTASDPLELFVLYSSVSATLGSRGQANHTAANAYLDALARARHARGEPALSIGWGAWSDVGAAADRDVVAQIDAKGLAAFTPDRGLAVLERVLARDDGHVVAMLFDLERYRRHSGAASLEPFLAGLGAHAGRPAPERAAPAARTEAAQADLAGRLRDAPAARRRPMVLGFVAERAKRALGLDPSREVDPGMPLGELGLDSLLAVELRNALSGALGRPLPATLLFDYPTIDALTDHLLPQLAPAEPATAVATDVAADAAGAPPASLVGSIESLSDDEVERQLAARMARTR